MRPIHNIGVMQHLATLCNEICDYICPCTCNNPVRARPDVSEASSDSSQNSQPGGLDNRPVVLLHALDFPEEEGIQEGAPE